MELTTAVLLDTHALLWILLEPHRIPPTTLSHLRDPGTTLLVSAASAWEIGTKFRLGTADSVLAAFPGLRVIW